MRVGREWRNYDASSLVLLTPRGLCDAVAVVSEGKVSGATGLIQERSVLIFVCRLLAGLSYLAVYIYLVSLWVRVQTVPLFVPLFLFSLWAVPSLCVGVGQCVPAYIYGCMHRSYKNIFLKMKRKKGRRERWGEWDRTSLGLVGVPGKEEENYLPLIFLNNERQLFPAVQFPSQQELITSLGHVA